MQVNAELQLDPSAPRSGCRTRDRPLFLAKPEELPSHLEPGFLKQAKAPVHLNCAPKLQKWEAVQSHKAPPAQSETLPHLSEARACRKRGVKGEQGVGRKGGISGKTMLRRFWGLLASAGGFYNLTPTVDAYPLGEVHLAATGRAAHGRTCLNHGVDTVKLLASVAGGPLAGKAVHSKPSGMPLTRQRARP